MIMNQESQWGFSPILKIFCLDMFVDSIRGATKNGARHLRHLWQIIQRLRLKMKEAELQVELSAGSFNLTARQ